MIINAYYIKAYFKYLKAIFISKQQFSNQTIIIEFSVLCRNLIRNIKKKLKNCDFDAD